MTDDFTSELAMVPKDEPAERAIIGALLMHSVYGSEAEGGDLPYRLAPLLSSADFMFEEYAWYYEAALALVERGEDITPTTVAHELDPGRVDSIGGLDRVRERLTEAAASQFTTVGIEAHARVVTSLAVYRRMLQAASQVARMAGDADPAKLDETLSAAVALMQGLADGRAALAAIPIREVVKDIGSGEELDPDYRRGITAGYPALDAKVQGLVPGEIVMIGAHTTVGKTSFALGMARRQAEHGVGVGYVPIEGNRKTLTHRLAASYSGTSLYYAREKGGWPAGAYDKYYAALGQLAELPIHFPNRYLADVEDIANWMTVQKHQEGLVCFYLDHIDAMTSQRTFRSRQAEMAHIMRTLEHTARREEVVVVVLSQVNRTIRRDKHPTMDQLREAGDKAELSQLILMLHQDEQGGFRVRVDKMTEGVVGAVVRPRSGDPAFELNRQSGAIDEVRSPGYYMDGNAGPAPWAD